MPEAAGRDKVRAHCSVERAPVSRHHPRTCRCTSPRTLIDVDAQTSDLARNGIGILAGEGALRLGRQQNLTPVGAFPVPGNLSQSTGQGLRRYVRFPAYPRNTARRHPLSRGTVFRASDRKPCGVDFQRGKGKTSTSNRNAGPRHPVFRRPDCVALPVVSIETTGVLVIENDDVAAVAPHGSPHAEGSHVRRKYDWLPTRGIRRAPQPRPFVVVEEQQHGWSDHQLLARNTSTGGTSPRRGPLLPIGRGPDHRIATRRRAR